MWVLVAPDVWRGEETRERVEEGLRSAGLRGAEVRHVRLLEGEARPLVEGLGRAVRAEAVAAAAAEAEKKAKGAVKGKPAAKGKAEPESASVSERLVRAEEVDRWVSGEVACVSVAGAEGGVAASAEELARALRSGSVGLVSGVLGAGCGEEWWATSGVLLSWGGEQAAELGGVVRGAVGRAEAAAEEERRREAAAASRRRDAWVEVEQVMEFLFPPRHQHPQSTSRLLALGLYGPLDASGRLRGSVGGRWGVTDHELSTMVAAVDEEDVLFVLAGTRAVGGHERAQILRETADIVKPLPQLSRTQVVALLDALPRDGRGRILFHHLQQLVLRLREQRRAELRDSFPDLKAAPKPALRAHAKVEAGFRPDTIDPRIRAPPALVGRGTTTLRPDATGFAATLLRNTHRLHRTAALAATATAGGGTARAAAASASASATATAASRSRRRVADASLAAALDVLGPSSAAAAAAGDGARRRRAGEDADALASTAERGAASAAAAASPFVHPPRVATIPRGVKMGDVERRRMLERMLGKNTHQIAHVADASDVAITLNARILRDEPALELDRWDRHAPFAVPLGKVESFVPSVHNAKRLGLV